jgi:hypothetical protein
MPKCRDELILISAFITAYDLGGISTGQLDMLARGTGKGYSVRRLGPSTYEIEGPARERILARELPNHSVKLTDISPPPVLAERVLACLIPPQRIEEALGDAEQGYHVMVVCHGVRFARFWYSWQIATIVARGAFNGVGRVIKIWTGLGPT